MKKIYYLFLMVLFQGSLFCSAEVPLHLDVYAGYRVDQFSWKIVSDTEENVLVYREKYERPRYLQTGISLSCLNNGLYFLTNIGYAPLLSHGMHMTDTYMDKEYTFDYRVKGNDVDGSIELGPTANLTPDRIYKFIVVPLVGYAGFWKVYKRYSPAPNPYVDVTGDDVSNLYSSLSSRKLKQVWYGPYVGGKFVIMPNKMINFDVGYHFNWMKLKVRNISSLEILTSENDGSLVSNELTKKVVDDSMNDCYAHCASAKLTFNTSKHLKIAFSGKFNYFMSDNEEMVFTIEETDVFPGSSNTKQNFKSKIYSRWWNVFGVFELIYEF